MSSIVLIATRHSNSGLCNSDELLKIIADIAPDVIFEEIPGDKFKAVYDSPRDLTLETSAIKRYLQKDPIDHFGVDLVIDHPTENFFRNEMKLFFGLARYDSEEYCDLLQELEDNTQLYGFPYLNGEECASLLTRIRALEASILEQRNDNALIERYFHWLRFIKSREEEMVRNIYNHYRNRKYEKGLLLVGAEHRQPIIEKIKVREATSEQKIDWIFDYF